MDNIDIGVLTILGIGVVGGILGATLFQRFRVPQVVGYIAVGVFLSEVGIGLVQQQDIHKFENINLFALGIIGFLVGGELQWEVFRKQGRQLVAILLGEGLGAFVLVGIPVSFIVYHVSSDWPTALAAGVVFGAIASATDPASTLNVLWEYRSRGVLTTTLITIVALDDALAMTLYGLGATTAKILTGTGGNLGVEVARTMGELALAGAIGVAGGILLRYVTVWLKRAEKNFASALGVLLLIIGIAAAAGLDVILAAMALGVTLVNLAPRRSKELFNTVRALAMPIYIIFFVLVGARFNVQAMPGWLWIIVAVYVVGRSIGKMAGAFAGARATRAEPAVQKYTGMGLFAQGGIAIGLSIMASQHLDGVLIDGDFALSDAIVLGITASTLIVQLTGPPLIKLAGHLAGELGRDVTEEDVIREWTVAEAMTKDITPITIQTPLSRVFEIFANNDHLVYPVVDEGGGLRGVISLDGLKDVMVNQDTWDWVLAHDVMAPAADAMTPETPLAEALETMRELGLEEVAVARGGATGEALGILDRRAVRIRVNEEVLRKRQTP